MIEAEDRARRRREPEWRRRRRRLIRRVSLGALAALGAFLLFLVVRAILTEPAEESVAEEYAAAWAAEDFEAMYRMLDSDSRDEIDADAFEEAYREAAATATATGFEAEDAETDEDEVVLPVTATTRVWGEVTGDVRLEVSGERLEWRPAMVFPGLGRGEELGRRTRAPQRAAILARNGTVLAQGDAGDRTSELDFDAGTVAGTLAPPPTREQADELYERGFSRDALTGITGLELVYEEQIAGIPGGVLTAGDRVLAEAEPRPAQAVRTTITPDVQSATLGALNRAGGIAVIDVETGEIRGATGALIGPQPPGSTFKVVTTVAALEAGAVEPSTDFPVQTGATIEGRTISNAGGASCGGSFTESFAESCNSVFAPLGVEVGAERLVETAERFGVNQDPPIPHADPSTMPPADEIASDLELGSTAIGQGRLLMTPYRLASISQAIAADGMLTEPTLNPAEPPERRRVTSPAVADTVEELMVGVTQSGATGDAAAISGIDVAGKTGTAELGEGITEHAWFTAFAPAGNDPKLAIAVMIANGGSGGQVAAPVARAVLEESL